MLCFFGDFNKNQRFFIRCPHRAKNLKLSPRSSRDSSDRNLQSIDVSTHLSLTLSCVADTPTSSSINLNQTRRLSGTIPSSPSPSIWETPPCNPAVATLLAKRCRLESLTREIS